MSNFVAEIGNISELLSPKNRIDLLEYAKAKLRTEELADIDYLRDKRKEKKANVTTN